MESVSTYFEHVIMDKLTEELLMASVEIMVELELVVIPGSGVAVHVVEVRLEVTVI